MAIKVAHDAGAPAASIEWMITQPLLDYDLEEVEAGAPREVDPILASQGFLDLIDDVRAAVTRDIAGSALEISQLTGAICHDHAVHRPGIWLVLRERPAAGSAANQMSDAGKRRVADLAEKVRSNFALS
ncbi:MAG: hypothetical protein WA737_10205 [Candidatus Acidiferrales bacterium]